MKIITVVLFLLVAATDGPSGSQVHEAGVEDGGNVTLFCTCDDCVDVKVAEWFINGCRLIANRSGGIDQDEQPALFKGKVSFLYPGNKKDFSITISSVNQTYNGNYTCEVRNRAKVLNRNTSHLTVKERSGVGDPRQNPGSDGGQNQPGINIKAMIWGPVGLILILILILIGGAVLCYCRKHNRGQNQNRRWEEVKMQDR